MKKEIGHVTEEERNEIQSIFERRNGLNELARILTIDDNELYDKLVNDMGQTTMLFQQWWDLTSQKYNWESSVNGRWEIDFQTCKIFLVEEK